MATEKRNWYQAKPEVIKAPEQPKAPKRVKKPRIVTGPDGKPVPFSLNPRSDTGRLLALIQQQPRRWSDLTELSLATTLTAKQICGCLCRLKKLFPDQVENLTHSGIWRWNSDDTAYATNRKKLYEINGWAPEPEDMVEEPDVPSAPKLVPNRISDWLPPVANREPIDEQPELPFEEMPEPALDLHYVDPVQEMKPVVEAASEQNAPQIGPKQYFRTVGVFYDGNLIITDVVTEMTYEAKPLVVQS